MKTVIIMSYVDGILVIPAEAGIQRKGNGFPLKTCGNDEKADITYVVFNK